MRQEVANFVAHWLPIVTTDATPFPDLIGGRYRIVSRLGVGGMGIVYKAFDEQLNRAVAVKALEDRRLFRPGGSGRLREEALAAASLDHPYICKVYEFVETATEAFIIMEFVEGETLSSMLKRGPLPVAQTLQIGREIAEGLSDAHTNGLVHRDVKPSNVMVTANGHVKLLDFGVAVEDVESAPTDQTRSVTPHLTTHAGTPLYMAPEQAAGQPVTARADLFSLGVVLYECLTGNLPFTGTSTFDYVRNMMQSAPRRLDRIAPEAPADLVELIERCLEKSPAARPASAEAVVSELRRLADGLASGHSSVSTARQARSGRRWNVIAAVAVLAVAGGLLIDWPGRTTGSPVRQLRPFVTSASQEYGSRISPDGQWISYIATSGGSSRVMVQRVDGGEPRPLTLGQGTPVTQLWSPDGSRIACVVRLGGDWVLQVYPAFFGGAPLSTVSLGPNFTQARLLRWIDQTLYLQINAPDVSLRRITADAADETDLTNLSASWTIDGTLRSVDVGPDGASAAFVQAVAGQEDLWMANLDGTSARALTSDAFFERFPLWNGRGDRLMFQSNRGGQIDLWEMDPRSGAATQLTSGEMEKVAESTSVDGSLISFQQLSHDAKLWLWGAGDDAGEQLTQDALSDYSPVVAGDGRQLAFQRGQPIPSRGFTNIDAKLFLAPFDGRVITSEPLAIADGFAPALSPDGSHVAFLQLGSVEGRATLRIHNLVSGATVTVAPSAPLPVSSRVPVDWASNTFAWTSSANGLYFVDQPTLTAESSIRLFQPNVPGVTEPGPAVVTSRTLDESFRDLYVSPQSGELAYLSAARDRVGLHVLNPAAGGQRLLASWNGPFTGVFGRGWWEDRLVIVRRVALHEDVTADIEVLVVDARTGAVTTAGRITNAFIATAKLHAARRALFVTRIENGVHNLHELDLTTGSLRALTRNTLPGVTFSGFHPAGAGSLVGTREERRQDIWLIQESGTTRPGNSADR
jgi:serine/threonine protein kinase